MPSYDGMRGYMHTLPKALAAWDSCSGIYCMSRLHFVPKEWLCIPCIHMCGLGSGKVTYTAKVTY